MICMYADDSDKKNIFPCVQYHKTSSSSLSSHYTCILNTDIKWVNEWMTECRELFRSLSLMHSLSLKIYIYTEWNKWDKGVHKGKACVSQDEHQFEEKKEKLWGPEKICLYKLLNYDENT